MPLQLGDTVPDFTRDSQLGPINRYDFAGDSWVELFSHPADYTPDCTTASTGRNFDEILLVIDSLQLTDHHQVATPVNWKDGKDCVVVPSIPTEEAHGRFPKGVTEIRPYLRTTPQPNR
jgi:alkyl hydroperoxide reductase subunit AhpC